MQKAINLFRIKKLRKTLKLKSLFSTTLLILVNREPNPTKLLLG